MSVTLQNPVKNSASLLLKWKIENVFKYHVSRYAIAVSANNSKYISFDDSQFLLKNKYLLGLLTFSKII